MAGNTAHISPRLLQPGKNFTGSGWCKMKGKFILVLGGSRSGKSEFAEKIAADTNKRVAYIATAAICDEEMAERVRLHQERRPGNWVTVEEKIDVPGVLAKYGQGDVLLLDCVTVWITNLLLEQQHSDLKSASMKNEQHILEQVARISEAVENGADLIVVSSEVGLGLIPEYPLGRVFRDLAGKANQLLALKADSVFLLVAGIPMEIKSDRQK
jgi:adenosylcobinamide kinase/adenosylcobinamide-phosphate guanylyltransferase